MSVKSTVFLTTEQAIERYINLKVNSRKLLRKLRAKAIAMNRVELENKLEELNDENHGGEGYENYIIEE